MTIWEKVNGRYIQVKTRSVGGYEYVSRSFVFFV
jgi:hypothetical protein